MLQRLNTWTSLLSRFADCDQCPAERYGKFDVQTIRAVNNLC